MALILTYRLEVPDGINREVYEALASQVGNVGLDLNIPINEDGSASATLHGQFISVEGEHAEERKAS
jgi:hypothetical protein